MGGDAIGMSDTMILCGAVSVVGFIVTYFFVEDCRGKDMDKTDKDEDEDAGSAYTPLRAEA